MRTDKHFKRYFSAPLPDDVVPCGRSAGDSRTGKDGFLWRVQTIVVAGFLESTGDVSGPSPWSTHAMKRGNADYHGLGPKQTQAWKEATPLRAETMAVSSGSSR